MATMRCATIASAASKPSSLLKMERVHRNVRSIGRRFLHEVVKIAVVVDRVPRMVNLLTKQWVDRVLVAQSFDLRSQGRVGTPR